MSSRCRPNIIYIFADQLRYQSCGYSGDEKAHTPNIDSFAKEGMNLVNAVSGHPVCSAYRASLFAGKYTTSTGMVINELRMNPNHRCLAHLLSEGGYHTGYIGKWHLYANEYGNHYDVNNSFVPPGPDRLGFDDFWAAYNFNHLYYKGYYHTDSPERRKIDGYEPDVQTDMAVEFIQRNSRQDEPFALFLSYGTPHDPWRKGNVLEKYYNMFAEVDFPMPPNYSLEKDPHGDSWSNVDQGPERIADWMRVYYAMAANLDWNLGRVLQALKESGLEDDTIVIFTSDHGEMFGAQGRMKKNIFYEEAVRVPFLIKWPGRIPAGAAADACLNTVDIMPSLLSLVDLPVPEGVEGMDISHLFRGEEGPEPEAALMQNTGACAVWEDGHEWRALRDKRFTYAVFRSDGAGFFYDNQQDPYQLYNLIDDPDYQAQIDNYQRLLQEKMAAINDDFRNSTWYRDNWIEDRIIKQTTTM